MSQTEEDTRDYIVERGTVFENLNSNTQIVQ